MRHALCLSSDAMTTGDEAAFDKDNYIETGMPAEAGELFPGKVVEHRDEGRHHLFVCDNYCALEVICLDARTVRFRFATNGDFSDDFS